MILLDDFNRADGALGANWALVNIHPALPVIQGNQAKVGSAESNAVWTPNVFATDQELSLKLGGLDGGGGHVYLLLDVLAAAPTAFTGYLLDIQFTAPAVAQIALFRGNAGGYTTLQNYVGGYAWAAGDVWSLRKLGNQLTLLRNGAALPAGAFAAPIVDPAPLTTAGMGGFAIRDSSTIRVDDFSAGAVVTAVINATVPTPPSLAICGEVLAGEALCGDMIPGDTYVEYALELVADPPNVIAIVQTNATVTVEETGVLELDGNGPVYVNPLLLDFDCIDLDLAASTCTPFDLEPSVVSTRSMKPLVCWDEGVIPPDVIPPELVEA